jgi:uroporphyrin-III C-methyltransferase/precorrin-2 dehydrogenase/sirohydrochlorin ferrochelatase
MTSAPERFYPVFLDLRGRACLVVGAGPVAIGKIRVLMEAGADVTIVAPAAAAPLPAWSEEGRVRWLRRKFRDADLDGCWLAIAATGDGAVNAAVFVGAERRRLLVNAVDDLAHSIFIAPATARSGAVQVAVTTGGHSPALAKRLRDRIQSELLSDGVARLAALLGSWRPAVKEALGGYTERQAFWEGVLDSCVPALTESGDATKASQTLGDALRRAASPAPPGACSVHSTRAASCPACARGWS